MITAVRLSLDPFLLRAMGEAGRKDTSLKEAVSDAVCNSDGSISLEVTADEATDWCESWLSRGALDAYLETDEIDEHELPEFCADPLIRDFVQTILKIYRLTTSV